MRRQLGSLTANQIIRVRASSLDVMVPGIEDAPVLLHDMNLRNVTDPGGRITVSYYFAGRGTPVFRERVALSTVVEIEEQTTNRTRGTT